MTPLKPGSVFGGVYEIVRPISAGGMGIVYEVIHRQTMRRRALKIMLAHIIDDPVMRARFSQEAVVAAGVRSEHITEVFDAGIDADSTCPYLVMELLEGEDLAARLKRGERYTMEETVEFLAQTARALAKTHEQGIVHRDLKPDNLFLTRRDDGSPRVKILDFGIAKVVKRSGTGAQATTNALGTPYYMAREQITGESRLIGPACDLYALTHIAFTMLVGVPYFHDEGHSSDGNILAVLLAVGTGVREPASARAARRQIALPTSFDAWFARGTALQPQDRFESAPEMIEALRLALGVAPAPLSSRAAISQPIPSAPFFAPVSRPMASAPPSGAGGAFPPSGAPPSQSFSSVPLPGAASQSFPRDPFGPSQSFPRDPFGPSQSFPSHPLPGSASQSFPRDPFSSSGSPSIPVASQSAPSSRSTELGPASLTFGGPASAHQTNSPQEIKNAQRAVGSSKRSWLFAATLSVGVAGALAFGAWRMSQRETGANTFTARTGSTEPATTDGAASPNATTPTSDRTKIAEQAAAPGADVPSKPSPAPSESASAASATAPTQQSAPLAARSPAPAQPPTVAPPVTATPPASPPPSPQAPSVSGYAGTKGPWESHL